MTIICSNITRMFIYCTILPSPSPRRLVGYVCLSVERLDMRLRHADRSEHRTFALVKLVGVWSRISLIPSSHLFLGRPVGRVPGGYHVGILLAGRESAIWIIWPYQRKIFLSIKRMRSSTLRFLPMLMLRSLSLFVTPRMSRKAFIHASCSLLFSCSVRVYVSLLYMRTGQSIDV